MLVQVDSDAVRRDQQEAIERVTAAVIAAQEILAGGSLATGKRKAGLSAADRPSKRARIYGFEDLSESDSDDDSESEAAAQLNQVGQIAATASSGNDSDTSAQEVALPIARDNPVHTHSRNVGGDLTERSTAAAILKSDSLSASVPSASRSKLTALSHARKPPPGQSLSRSQAVTDADEPAAAAAAAAIMTPEGSSVPADAKASSALPAAADRPSSIRKTEKEPASDDKEPVALWADDRPLDLSDFASPAELEAAGLVKLKHELARHGLKCGGSLSERAARLFLLKGTSVDKLDQKHFSKTIKKK